MDNSNNSYKLANLDAKGKEYLNELESKIKSETGKDVALVQWEKLL